MKDHREIKTQVVGAIQTRLKDLGDYTGRLDYQEGPLMHQAVRDFKVRHGLRDRMYVGPVTLRTMFDNNAKPAPKPVFPKGISVNQKGMMPPWLAEAYRLEGTKEIPGSGESNPVIMGWASDLDQWFDDDDTAWCGLFAGHCCAKGAPQEPQNFNRLGARQWLKWGVENPGWYGSVCVLWRGNRSGWQGHVFFATAMDDNWVYGIGGNQGNMVKVSRFDKDRILGFRGPKNWQGVTLPLPGEGPVAISINEG